MNEKNRFDYIDIAKGLGILMVIWGHITTHWTRSFVYTYHMPMFFIFSGMLFRSSKFNSFGEFAGKRVKRLFLPYVLYSIATWAIWAGFNYVRGVEVESYWYPLLQTVLAYGSGQFFVYNSPLWFIPCLFAIEIMYFFTSQFKDVLNIALCIGLIFVSVGLEHVFGYDYLYLLPWNFDAALMALPLYAAGNLLVKHVSLSQIYESVSKYRILALGGAISFAVLLALSLNVWNSISMGYSYYGNEWVFPVRALMGTAMVLMFAIMIESSTWMSKLKKSLVWCGRNSLDIMCTHVPIKGVIIMVLAKGLHMDQSSATTLLWFSLAAFAITTILDTLCVGFINRYIKPLGSRKNNKLKQ